MGYIGHYGDLAEKTYESLRHFGKNNVELVLKKTKNDIFRVYKETLPDGKKAIMAMKLKDILSIPNITKQELSAICDLQDAIKNGSVLSFLIVEESAPKEERADKENGRDET